MPEENENIEIVITPDDLAVCECSSQIFLPAMSVVVKKNPIIGQEPIVINKIDFFRCINCNKPLHPKNYLKTKEEKENEKN